MFIRAKQFLKRTIPHCIRAYVDKPCSGIFVRRGCPLMNDQANRNQLLLLYAATQQEFERTTENRTGRTESRAKCHATSESDWRKPSGLGRLWRLLFPSTPCLLDGRRF